MELNLKVGMKYESSITVQEEHTAVKFGSGSIYVLATPMMIGLMENAAMKAVEAALPEGFTTVGINVNADHLAATPMGMTARAVAELTEIEGKKLTFKVEAFDNNEKIGEGTHTRFVINIEKFMAKTSQKK